MSDSRDPTDEDVGFPVIPNRKPTRITSLPKAKWLPFGLAVAGMISIFVAVLLGFKPAGSDEIKALRKEVVFLKDKLNIISDRVSGLSNTMVELKQEVRQLSEQLGPLENELETLKKDLGKLQENPRVPANTISRLEKIEKELARISGEVAKFRNSNK